MGIEANLVFGGDFIIPSNANIRVDSKLRAYFLNSNSCVVNLEGPLLNGDADKKKISKTGPNIFSQTKPTLKILDQLNVDMVNLANNHILDYGNYGLSETVKALKGNKMFYTGVGENLSSASKPLIRVINGLTFGFISVAENEWANAKVNKAGANPLDIIHNQRLIMKTAAEVDFLIFQYHGGHEHYKYPSPELQKILRFYAESGADLILTHHSHIISGYEIHNECPIFYGLGNFTFPTKKKQKDYWYKGLVVKANFSKSKPVGFEVDVVKYDYSKGELSLYAGSKDFLMEHMTKINQVIQNPTRILEEWNQFLIYKQDQYFRVLSPIRGVRNRYLRGFLFLFHFHKFLYSRTYLLELLNMIRCESHSDAVKGILENKMSEYSKK